MEACFRLTQRLFAQASSSAVHFGAFVLLGLWQVSYPQILTGKMKIAKAFYKKLLSA